MSWVTERTLNWFQFFILTIVKTGRIPKHVAFIMDGNRRYANKYQMQTTEGHKLGFKKLIETLSWCKDLGITEVTVYAFSIDNFKRSKEEVDDLMNLVKEKFEAILEEKDKIMKNGLCVRIIGNLSLISKDVGKIIAEAINMTKNNNKLFLNIAFAYTSRDEITHAIKDIVKGVQHNDILVEDINEQLISNCLYTYNSSNLDLLIHTSGETRLSDFLMWQISDTCIYFCKTLWPEFTIWNFLAAIFYYQCTEFQSNIKMENSKSITYNNRVSIYINKLHHERQVRIEEMSTNS